MSRMSNWIRIPLKIILFPIYLVVSAFLLCFKGLIEIGTGIMTFVSFLFLITLIWEYYQFGYWSTLGIVSTIFLSPIGLPLIITFLIAALESICDGIKSI